MRVVISLPTDVEYVKKPASQISNLGQYEASRCCGTNAAPLLEAVRMTEMSAGWHYSDNSRVGRAGAVRTIRCKSWSFLYVSSKLKQSYKTSLRRVDLIQERVEVRKAWDE